MRAPTRFTILAAIVLTVTATMPVTAGSKPSVTLREFASGLATPTDIASSGGDPRLFVAEQPGVIRIVSTDGTVAPDPFLNISERVRSGGEEGLLGLAFAPDYETSGRFFVYYTRHDGNNQVSSFTRIDDGRADPASETPILTIPHPGFTNHNGGDLAFDDEGLLYIATGDGGASGDPDNSAQDPESILGKVLRLDVTSDAFPNDATRNYSIPGDNPFVSGAGANEVWVLGLRNPWRFSFDAENGNLFLSDVGEGEREEINFKASDTPGGDNFGWRCYEGSVVFDFSACNASTPFTFPVAEYENTGNRCAVTGGYVYRGDLYPRLRGDYFYMDFCSGELFSFKAHHHKGMAGPVRALGTFEGLMISTFGEGADGELYAADLVSGKIYRLEG